MSVPSNVTVPAVGSSSRSEHPAERRLARARLADQPDRATGRRPRGRRRRPRARGRPCGGACRVDREVLHDVLRAFEDGAVDVVATALQRELVDPDATGAVLPSPAARQLDRRGRALGDRVRATRVEPAPGRHRVADPARRRGSTPAARRAPATCGIAASRPFGVRVLRGARTALDRASSTTWPAYITTTREQRSAITPRSWVTKITAMPSRACSDRSRSRICACTVTSSAVVGSSAISRRGSHDSASASRARWRMPPESWWGSP